MRTFIGTGLLGSGFVRAGLKKGEKITVWNRTASKAEKLKEYGAVVAPTLEDAVRNSDRIHLVLRDDAAVDEVLSAAEKALKPGTFIIDHTTTSVDGAVKRTRGWKEKGFVYQHAPVQMGPKNALESTGFMYISGSQQDIAELTPELETMTGTLMNFGEEVGQAAGMKLISNLILLAVNAGIADVLAIAKTLHIPVEDLAKLPGIAGNRIVKGGFNKIIRNTFDQPTWELTMARKDAQLMMDEAAKGDWQLIAVSAIAAEMDKWLEKGAAQKDWTIFASDKL